MFPPTRFLWPMFILCLSLSASTTAHCSPNEDKSAARTLATEANAAMEAGEYQKAVDLLKKAERQYHAPTHLLMMALAHIELGQFVQAEEQLYAILNSPASSDTNAAFKASREQAEKLLPAVSDRVAKLVLRVNPEDVSDLNVSLNGKPMSTDLLGVARRSNPGTVLVEVSAPGYESQSREIVLGEGESQQLVFELKAAPKTAKARNHTEGPAPVETKPRYRPGAFVSLGLGVAAAGAGTALFILSSSDTSKADAKFLAECETNLEGEVECPGTVADELSKLDRSAANKKTAAIISVSVGAAAIATGVVFLVLGSKHSTEVALTSSVRIRPTFAPARGTSVWGIAGSF